MFLFKNVLVVDDSQDRHDEFRRVLEGTVVSMLGLRHVRRASEAIRFLNVGPRYDLVCLDHDLGDETPGVHQFESREAYENYMGTIGDGMMVAEYIAMRLAPAKFPGLVLVHSWNTVRAPIMDKVISMVGIPVIRKEFSVPMDWLPKLLLEVVNRRKSHE